MSKKKDTFKYKGFQRPNYTAVPNDLFDEVMVELTNSELRILLYIMRRTFGFGKKADDISVAQMTDGIVTNDGRRLDRGTGLSKAAVRRAVAHLVEMGLITAIRQADKHGGSLPTTYKVRFENDEEEGVSPMRPPGATELTPPESHSGDPRSLTDETHNIKLTQNKDKEYSNRVSQDFSDEARKLIESYIADFAHEMNDQAPLNSSVTRALRLWDEAGVDQSTFISAMYVARSRTQQYTGSIKHGDPGRRNKMPYFFRVLEDVLNGNADRGS